jgi:hypothetical protein
MTDVLPYGRDEHDVFDAHLSCFAEAERHHPLAQCRQSGKNPVIDRIGAREQELIKWCWGLDRPQRELAERSETPTSGKMEDRLPLLVREAMLLEITGRFHSSR